MDSAPPKQIPIFANPIAGRGKGLAIGRRLEKRLRSDGHEPSLVLKRPRDLQPADLCDHPAAAIVIGGDGTLREVAERLCEISEPAPPPLLVVPLGTANLMGRNLGIAWKDATLEEQISRTIDGGHIVERDVGRVNGKLFLLMVGVGFDAAVVHELARIRKGPITKLNYLVPAAFAMAQYQYPPLSVLVDGRRVFGPSPGVVMIANLPEYGTGFPILPKASGDDGLLDVCVFPARTPFDVAKVVLLSTTGHHLTLDGVVATTGRQVQVQAEHSIPVQIDGDAAGQTPVTAELMSIRLRFVVPSEESLVISH